MNVPPLWAILMAMTMRQCSAKRIDEAYSGLP